MYEIHLASKAAIEKGDFPLNHDCILKVTYLQGSPLRYCYLTCRAQDSGALVAIITELSLVRCVNVSSVENFDL